MLSFKVINKYGEDVALCRNSQVACFIVAQMAQLNSNCRVSFKGKTIWHEGKEEKSLVNDFHSALDIIKERIGKIQEHFSKLALH